MNRYRSTPRVAAALALMVAALAAALVSGACGEGGSTPPSPTVPPPTPAPTPAPEPDPPVAGPEPITDLYRFWNELPAEPWWKESTPYSCDEPENPASPWLAAGLPDPGGADPLSLIRFFGNGSYLRYGFMGFTGCTVSTKDPEGFHLDPPADPTYYSLGDLEITVDLARIPQNASGWFADNGRRVDISLREAVELLNAYIGPYYRRISDGWLRMTFRAGVEFDAPGDGSPDAIKNHQFAEFGACLGGTCELGAPGGMNRILLNDVASASGGNAYNGWAHLGLASFEAQEMGTLVHEIGHGWMSWPHSFAEVLWRPYPGDSLEPPNPYGNFFDVMSSSGAGGTGWDTRITSTLAINRYSAGWIQPGDVALHVNASGVYTLVPPGRPGKRFLVLNSGRRHAFTTIEVLDEIPRAFRNTESEVYDPSAPGGRRQLRYEGVYVARYDQSTGTGTRARIGPALYNRNNPDYLSDVGWGFDDTALLADGDSRDIGGGIRVSASRNNDGSYEVRVTGGPIAEFERWCFPLWFASDLLQYDTGCYLDTAVW